MSTPIITRQFNPAVGLVALSAGLLPYSGLLNPWIPGFIPEVLHTPIEASLGVLASVYLLEFIHSKSLTPLDKKWKERFILAGFLGALAGSLLGEPVLGIEDKALDSLAAASAVLGSYFSPFHLIKD